MTSRDDRRSTSIRFASVVLILTCATNATAQDRMPPIPEEQMTGAQREAVEEFNRARNTTAGPFGPFVPLLQKS